MIDWVNVKLPLLHSPIYTGEVISITSDGEEEWRSPKRQQVTGSYDKAISIRSVGGDGTGLATHLHLSGNPSKFLQGHNVFGSDDIVSLVYDSYRNICNHLRLTPTFNELRNVKNGNYELSNVDINYSFELPTKADVLAFIRALEYKSSTRNGRPTNKGGTIYFQHGSSRWKLKIYCKHEEIQTRRGELPEELKKTYIPKWAENKLRIELTLLSKQLKEEGIMRANQLTPEIVKNMFSNYVRKIQMSDQIALSNEIICELPNRLKSTYTLWSEGHDLRSMMSRATYSRHRKELKEFDINIDLKPASCEKTIVVPMLRILEAKPAEIPTWAFQQRLIHHSAARH